MKKIIIVIIVFCASISISAQEKLNKISQSVNVTNDVTIDLNTSYVQIEVDTWNKDVIEIEAYVESKKLSKEELRKTLDNWDINIEGSGDYVSIFSKGDKNSWSMINTEGFDFNIDALRELELELANLPELPELPEMPELPAMPKLPNMNIPEMPKLPELPELPEGINSINFDTDAYKKDGEKYLEKWSKTYEDSYGKEYKEKMKVWAREFSKIDFSAFEKDMEKWGEEFGKTFGKDYEKKMEAWSKEFDKKWSKEYEQKMEAWGEKFGEEMEKRAQEMEKRNEEREGQIAKRQAEIEKRLEERQSRLENRNNDLARELESKSTNVKKVIKIKMPKKAKLNLNVRHGELKFSSIINNLKADISHSTLVANHIDGSETSINVSYSPVSITTWNSGELKLNFVDKAQIDTVNHMVLNSNSSNINIGNLSGNAIIDGSFGDLTIRSIAESFNNLNIVLENSDALISLPKTSYNLQYKGNRSRLSHPKKAISESVSNFSTGNLSSNKTIIVNAKFSHVIMQ